jgi:hypothetical protein
MDAYHKEYDGETYSLILVPLMDFKGEQIGLIVAAKTMRYFENLRSSLFWNNIFVACGQALVITGITSILFNGLLLRPIVSLGRGVKSMLGQKDSKEETSSSIDYLSTRRDEVGEIARDCKKLQSHILDGNQASRDSHS